MVSCFDTLYLRIRQNLKVSNILQAYQPYKTIPISHIQLQEILVSSEKQHLYYIRAELMIPRNIPKIQAIRQFFPVLT